MASAIRLYVDHPLGEGQRVPLTRDQVHYLTNVMRLAIGAEVLVFNGKDGEWAAVLEEASKRSGILAVKRQTGPLLPPPDLWLLFAPIKKERTDFIVEKATELGISQIFPVQTDFTNTTRINLQRLQAHAIEAAEQCGGTFVPEVHEMQKLDRILQTWENDTGGRMLMWCREWAGTSPNAPLSQFDRGTPWAILIGPEGGFSERESTLQSGAWWNYPYGLGPRILRADTAAVAAITLWQQYLGDWPGDAF